MTVKELIAELSKFDLDEEVVIADAIKKCWAINIKEITEVKLYQISWDGESKVLLG